MQYNAIADVEQSEIIYAGLTVGILEEWLAGEQFVEKIHFVTVVVTVTKLFMRRSGVL